MRYYIADCHFFHENMNNRMDMRGFFSKEEMNKYMIKQWNGRVKRNDEVVILGDLSYGNAKETETVLQTLNGVKTLIIGNHERYLNDKAFNKALFKKISYYEEMNDNKRKVILSHYPIFCYNGQNRLDELGNPKTYMLHGHTHNTDDQTLVDKFIQETKKIKRFISGKEISIPCNIINCFCMRSDYVPLTLDEWIVVDKKSS